MFEIGTKICLAASSCEKKTGPKRGSLGYVSKIVNPIAYREHNIVVCRLSVVFYRYGFEQKTRVEKQKLVAAFPMADSSKGDIYPQVEETVDLISGKHGQDWADALRSFYALPKKGTIAIVVPVEVNEHSLMDCSNDEFKAMITAHSTCDEFQMYLHRVSMSGHFRNARNEKLASSSNWHTLQNMSADRTFRGRMFRDWLSNTKSRKDAVTFIRMVMAMMQRKNYAKLILNASNALNSTINSRSKDKSITTSLAYDSLTKVLFIRPVIRKLMEDCITGGDKRILAFLEDVEITRGTLLLLSDRLERKYSLQSSI